MDAKLAQMAPALGKGLEILELLSRSSSPLSLSEIARALDRSVSEMQRIVKVLVNLGYLARDNHGGYILTARLLELGRHYPPFRWLTDAALPEMEAFADSTGESVHLGVVAGSAMLILDQVVGRQLVNVSLEVGSMHPLIDTVSGRLLLGEFDDADLRPHLAHLRLSRAKSEAFFQELKEINHKGWHASPSNRYRGLNDLGVPIRDSRNRLCAALTTTWIQTTDDSKSTKSLLRPLQSASRRIQARLKA
jgi:DNA-binding IclR family transcriptional regulator